MQRIFTVFFLTISIIGCDQTQISDEEVFKDVLPQIVEQNLGLMDDTPHIKVVVGVDENPLILLDHEIETIKSIRSVLGSYFEDKLSGLDSIAFVKPLDELIERNSTDFHPIIIPRIEIEGNIEILSTSEINNIYPRGNYDSTKIDISKSLRVTNVYLNSNQTEGFLVAEYICGTECGHSNLVFLKLINEKWTILEEELLWVS